MTTTIHSGDLLNTASIIIPSNRDDVITEASIPDGLDYTVQRDNGLNNARHNGVLNAEKEIVVILDDDLEFDVEWLRELIGKVHDNPNTVFTAKATGIFAELNWPDRFEPGMGRVMAFHRSIYPRVPGFPLGWSHGGDTDFLMQTYEVGLTVRGIDHEWEHHDTVDHYSFGENLDWFFSLYNNHYPLLTPRVPQLVKKVFLE